MPSRAVTCSLVVLGKVWASPIFLFDELLYARQIIRDISHVSRFGMGINLSACKRGISMFWMVEVLYVLHATNEPDNRYLHFPGEPSVILVEI